MQYNPRMNEHNPNAPFATYRRILTASLRKLDALAKDHRRFGLDSTETRLRARALLDIAQNNERQLEVVQAHLRRITEA